MKWNGPHTIAASRGCSITTFAGVGRHYILKPPWTRIASSARHRSLSKSLLHMSIISTLKHCVPRPLRPPVRKLVHTLVPSLRYRSRVQTEIGTYTGIENVHDLPAIAHYWSEKY